MSNQTLKDWRELIARKAIKEPRHRSRRDRLELLMAAATILSAIATTAAVVVGFYQYSVAREQLVAADRNRSIQTMMEQVRTTCEVLSEISFTRSVAPRADRQTVVKDDVRAYVKALFDDIMNAEREGREYYDADTIRRLEITEDFRVRYSKAYRDLRSAVQTLRLWVADRDLLSLEKLSGQGLVRLDPGLVLGAGNWKSPVLDERDLDYFPNFGNLQIARAFCPRFEAIIVDWAKGKDVVFPDYRVLPVLKKEVAEQQVRETGKVRSSRMQAKPIDEKE